MPGDFLRIALIFDLRCLCKIKWIFILDWMLEARSAPWLMAIGPEWFIGGLNGLPKLHAGRNQLLMSLFGTVGNLFQPQTVTLVVGASIGEP